MKNLEIYKWPIEPKYKMLEYDKYGLRHVHQIIKTPRFHSGLDITAETLTEVYPASEGKVIYAGLDYKITSGQDPWNHRYGNMVVIIDNYERKIIYAHLRKILVKVGDSVSFDDVIALSGCSGGARVPHLHFEIRKNADSHSGEANTIDPLLLLPERDLQSLNMEFTEEPYAVTWRRMVETGGLITDDEIPYCRDRKLIR